MPSPAACTVELPTEIFHEIAGAADLKTARTLSLIRVFNPIARKRQMVTIAMHPETSNKRLDGFVSYAKKYSDDINSIKRIILSCPTDWNTSPDLVFFFNTVIKTLDKKLKETSKELELELRQCTCVYDVSVTFPNSLMIPFGRITSLVLKQIEFPVHYFDNFKCLQTLKIGSQVSFSDLDNAHVPGYASLKPTELFLTFENVSTGDAQAEVHPNAEMLVLLLTEAGSLANLPVISLSSCLKVTCAFNYCTGDQWAYNHLRYTAKQLFSRGDLDSFHSDAKPINSLVIAARNAQSLTSGCSERLIQPHGWNYGQQEASLYIIDQFDGKHIGTLYCGKICGAIHDYLITDRFRKVYVTFDVNEGHSEEDLQCFFASLDDEWYDLEKLLIKLRVLSQEEIYLNVSFRGVHKYQQGDSPAALTNGIEARVAEASDVLERHITSMIHAINANHSTEWTPKGNGDAETTVCRLKSVKQEYYALSLTIA